jgi:hypothetical protein
VVNPVKGRPDRVPNEYGAVAALLKLVPDEEAPAIPSVPFRTDYATGRLGLLALNSLRPKAPNGEEIDVAGALEAHGMDAITDVVSDRRGDLAARGFWPRGGPPPSGKESQMVLRSHAINEEAARALRTGDTTKFLAVRRSIVEELLHRYLSARLEAGSLVRPSLASLIVEDDKAVGNPDG